MPLYFQKTRIYFLALIIFLQIISVSFMALSNSMYPHLLFALLFFRKSDVPNVVHIDVDIVFSYFDNNHRDKLPSCKNKRFVQLSIRKYTAFISEDKGRCLSNFCT